MADIPDSSFWQSLQKSKSMRRYTDSRIRGNECNELQNVDTGSKSAMATSHVVCASDETLHAHTGPTSEGGLEGHLYQTEILE